jgi:dienelactone hydrolase
MKRLWLPTTLLLAAGCASPRPEILVPRVDARPEAPQPTRVPGFVRELRTIRIALPDGGRATLDALVTRPDRPGRLPLVLLNHGSPRDGSERVKMSPTQFAGQSLAFARRGYGAVAVMRRGFGATGGRFVEGRGPCESSDYVRAGRASAEDVLGALRSLEDEPWVDRDRILLVGHSAGGLAIVATGATNPKGVLGLVSFAGGRGSDEIDHVCQPERLVAAVGTFGETARVPAMWLYQENDHFFAPPLAREMADAYHAGGAPLDFVAGPPFGEDGHTFFLRAPAEAWWSLVAPFLERLKLPTAVDAPPSPAALTPPASLSAAGREGFALYLASEGFEKAFAVDGAAWGWVSGKRTAAEAADGALERCRKSGRDACQIYALGNSYAR